MTKETYLESMKMREEQAEIEYAKQLKEDEGKTYLDILPAEFKNFKRSIIKRNIIEHIKRVTLFLNECSLYDGRIFTELHVTRYMMRGTLNNNFYLAEKYIPSKNSFEILYIPDIKKYTEEQKRILRKPYDDLSTELGWLRQSWDSWLLRQKVKTGNMDDYDLDENGTPRTSRANLCSVFIPVKGKWNNNQTGFLKLKNPRNKKTVVLEIVKFVKKENVFICLNNNKRTLYLTPFESVQDAWIDLFDINKEIYSGWWNKTLIWK